MAWLSAVRSWPPKVESLFGSERNELLAVEGMNDQCDVVCYREREGEVNSLTLLYLNQH